MGVLDFLQEVVVPFVDLLDGFLFIIDADGSPEDTLLVQSLWPHLEVGYEEFQDDGHLDVRELLNSRLGT